MIFDNNINDEIEKDFVHFLDSLLLNDDPQRLVHITHCLHILCSDDKFHQFSEGSYCKSNSIYSGFLPQTFTMAALSE